MKVPARFWRGELALLQSLCVGAALVIAGSLLVDGLATFALVRGAALQATSIAWLLAWPLLLVLTAWFAVGCWRSVGESERLAWVARVCVVGVSGWVLATFVWHGLPHTRAMLKFAARGDEAGALQATVSADGLTLKLSGNIANGDAARLRGWQAAKPPPQRIDLAASGTRRAEAQAMASDISAAGLTTRATGACNNACALLLLAGQRRQMLPQAQLGLQRAEVPSFNPLWHYWASQDQALAYRSAGLPPMIAQRALATPPSWLWFPERDVLHASGVLTAPPLPLGADLPAASAEGAEYAQALSTNPHWQALEQRFPGIGASTAERMRAARQSAPAADADRAANVAAHQAAIDQFSPLLANASGETRQLFLSLLAEQMQALGHPGACRQHLTGDAAVRHDLPPALALKEAQWLAGAISEAPVEASARPLTALEREVMRRALGERASAALPQLWMRAPRSASTLDCESAQTLIAQVLNLSAAERRLAMRHLFARL